MLLSCPLYAQDQTLLARADSLHQLGKRLAADEQYKTAITCFEEAASIRKNQLGIYSSLSASSINAIGICYDILGNYDKALEYYIQALTISEKILGKEHPNYAFCLSNIGDCYGDLGDYNKALEYHQQALAILESVYGKEHSTYVTSLTDVGDCYANLRNFTKALECFLEALAINEKIYGKIHPNYGSSLYYIGDFYNFLGDYAHALEFYRQALTIRETLYGNEHPDYVSNLDDIGDCYKYLNDYAHALEFYQQALTISELLYGQDNLDYVSRLSNVEICSLELGVYDKALEFCQQALTILEKLFGKEHPEYASTLNEIGIIYYDLGIYDKSLEFCQQALQIRERLFGKEHPDYASSLNEIGNHYSARNNYEKALECYLQVLVIVENVYGNDSLLYANCLNNIGACYPDLGDYTKALEYHQRALAIREKVYGKEHPDYALSLNNIGACYHDLGDYAKALEYYLQSLAIREKVYGKEHPDYALSLDNIGSCYSDLGDYAKAAECFSAYSSLAGDLVTRTFSSLTESQRESFWKKYSFFYTNRLYDYSTTISSPQMNIAAYDGALLGKGLLLNAETEMRKLILESGDEEALLMYNEVQESRIRLDKIYENPVGKKEQIDSLNNDIEVRQQELMKRSKTFGDYTRNLALKWTDVQAALGKKDIAIEFETYTRQDTTFYIALTLRPGYTEPHLVELFNSKELDGLKPRDYDKTPFSNRIYQSARMTGLVWGKLEEELRGAENVFFSPAGELHNIGIEYFLDEDGEHLLSEKRNYYRLTSTRELAKEHQIHRMSDATVYGGIDYNVTPGTKLTGNETESERLALAAARSYMLDSLSVKRGGGDVWTYLEGSEKEARAVSSTLTSMRVRNELLDGERGTEESFKALSGAKKDVIHISTHGFYYQSEKDAGHDHMDVSSFMLGDESIAPKEDKALTRSGLLFAGANNTFAGKEIPLDVEDGVLTAKDISRMDLRGTDLVVLSACQTGLGEVSGDGVFGLQRGFKKAGVQSIVMSLWEVDDTATKIMMTRFYENLAKGRSKYDAFLEAQKYLRKYVDEEGRTYDEPEYYAAFVLLDAIK